MKKKLTLVVLGASILLITGCASVPADSDSSQNGETERTQQVSGDYVSGFVGKNETGKVNKDNSTNKNINQNKDNAMPSQSEQKNDRDSIEYGKQFQFAVLDTNLGKIKLKFYPTDAPMTVNNFLKLADQKFYDGLKFHRVIKGFMIQGGDPNSKNGDPATWGQGGPGYTIPAEIKLKNKRGTVATARLGDQVNPKKESSGSQFFINTVDNAFLDGNYTVFGEVVEGMDVVDKIESVKTGPGDRPVENVTISSIDLVK